MPNTVKPSSTVEEIHAEKARHHRLVVQSYRAKADAKRTLSDKFADKLTSRFGSVIFLSLNAIWFIVWVVFNTGLVPGIEPFDPFPFGLLTMIVSLEAIFLAIIVLISQNRAAKVAELREEIDLQINSIAETEISKAIVLLELLLDKSGIQIDDPDIADMVRPIRSADIERALEKQLK
ncbi:DUF1003 domain-containing protein [Candidatus Saccharibacteria bacterium]|nr:DUF1003 domain-containing protein [Candidatus Saccharibacteria bacterium]NCS83068.1 DUF1003 domain-containing protein [Candidatus Saccharibacteria bacterium]